MSYGLRTFRGVQGLGVMRVRGYGFRGLGDTPLVPLPNYATCDPRDTACTVANQALSDKYNLDLEQAQAANNLAGCLSNANNATPGPQRDAALAACSGQYATQGGSPASLPALFTSGGGGSPMSAPSFSFTTSRGGTALQVGDTWTISITGAAPGTSVWSSGSMPSGPYLNQVFGRTDGNGNFTLTGTADASTVGNWSERWNVGNTAVGQVQFTVTPVAKSPANPPGAPAASPGVSLPAPASPPASAVSSGFDVSSIPWWGWAAGAGVAVLAFSGGGKR